MSPVGGGVKEETEPEILIVLSETSVMGPERLLLSRTLEMARALRSLLLVKRRSSARVTFTISPTLRSLRVMVSRLSVGGRGGVSVVGDFRA